MPPRRRPVVPSPEPERPSPSPAPALQPTDSQESFGLGNVSGSDEPADSDHGHDEGVNNPDAIPKRRDKGGPADIQFFFDRTGNKVVCKECR